MHDRTQTPPKPRGRGPARTTLNTQMHLMGRHNQQGKVYPHREAMKADKDKHGGNLLSWAHPIGRPPPCICSPHAKGDDGRLQLP